MKINAGVVILGLVFCVFMGITVISIGFGSIFPALNEIAGPFVCPNAQLALGVQNYQVSPVENGSVLTWYCFDSKTGIKTELNPFTTINLYAGFIYGLLMFVVICIIWYVSYRRRLTPHEETAQSKKRNQWIPTFMVIAFVVAVTIFNLRPLFSPLVDTTGVIQITIPPPTAFVTPTPQGLILSFGGPGTGPGLFKAVRGLGVNPSTGTVFAADSDGRVQAFDSNGKFVTQWLVGASPIIITADSKGNVFVATLGEKILRYDANGELTATLTVPGASVQHMVVGPDGNLVVAAVKVAGTVDDMILRMTPDGKVLNTIHNAFTDNGGQIEHEMRVAVDGTRDVYVLGRDNNAVLKFSPDGKFIQRVGSEGDAPGQLNIPESIAVDGQGRVYIQDSKGIQSFNSDGNYLALVEADIYHVYDIAFDAQNNMYVTTNNDQVLKLSVPNP
jgi:sugar lactone lactonase YvrE